MIEINISKSDAENLADLVETYFFQNIRDDPDMDNIDYIKSLLRGLDELRRVSTERGDKNA